MSTGTVVFQSTVRMSPRLSTPGEAVGQDGTGGPVGFGVPGEVCAEDGLHGEVESAVAGAQRPDPQALRAGRGRRVLTAHATSRSAATHPGTAPGAGRGAGGVGVVAGSSVAGSSVAGSSVAGSSACGVCGQVHGPQ